MRAFVWPIGDSGVITAVVVSVFVKKASWGFLLAALLISHNLQGADFPAKLREGTGAAKLEAANRGWLCRALVLGFGLLVVGHVAHAVHTGVWAVEEWEALPTTVQDTRDREEARAGALKLFDGLPWVPDGYYEKAELAIPGQDAMLRFARPRDRSVQRLFHVRILSRDGTRELVKGYFDFPEPGDFRVETVVRFIRRVDREGNATLEWELLHSGVQELTIRLGADGKVTGVRYRSEVANHPEENEHFSVGF